MQVPSTPCSRTESAVEERESRSDAPGAHPNNAPIPRDGLSGHRKKAGEQQIRQESDAWCEFQRLNFRNSCFFSETFLP